MIKNLFLLISSLFAIQLIFPQAASAHAFGKLYNLPVPFWLYLYGAGAALIASFLIIAYFSTQKSQNPASPKKDISRFIYAALLTKGWFLNLLKVSGFFLFLLTILSGIFGANDPLLNFSMTFFWVIFVLGFTYLTALVGNLWVILNPWKNLTDFLSWIKLFRPGYNYPKQLAYYPALFFYFLFIWVELFAKTSPFSLSIVLIIYTLVNLLAVKLFGKDWFYYGEFFSVFFRLIDKIAPLEYKDRKVYLRPPFAGLLNEKVEHFSLLLFILFMLSSTAFDGFRATLSWDRLYWDNLDPLFRPILGNPSVLIFLTVGLIVSFLLFILVYIDLVVTSKLIAKNQASIKAMLLTFAISLVPIALVYNAAHYYTLLFTEGQNLIRHVSDPLGRGWNLFGTSGYQTNIAFINANTTWNIQVALILIGHIASVYIAHRIALKLFPSHKSALFSQIPMLFLMVIYTVVGLWILSQPIAPR